MNRYGIEQVGDSYRMFERVQNIHKQFGYEKITRLWASSLRTLREQIPNVIEECGPGQISGL